MKKIVILSLSWALFCCLNFSGFPLAQKAVGVYFLAPYLSGVEKSSESVKSRLLQKTDKKIVQTASGYFYTGTKRPAQVVADKFSPSALWTIEQCRGNSQRFVLTSDKSLEQEDSLLVEFSDEQGEVEIFIPAAGDSKGWFVLLDEVAKLDPELRRAAADLKLRFLQFWEDRKKRHIKQGVYNGRTYSPVMTARNQAVVAAFFKNHPVMRHILTKLADGSVSYGAKLRYASQSDELQDEMDIQNIMSEKSSDFEASVADSTRIIFDRTFLDSTPEKLLALGRKHVSFINKIKLIPEFSRPQFQGKMNTPELKELVVELMLMVYFKQSHKSFFDKSQNFVTALDLFDSDIDFLVENGFLPADRDIDFSPRKDPVELGCQALKNGQIKRAEAYFNTSRATPSAAAYAKAAKAYEQSSVVDRKLEAAKWYLRSARQNFEKGYYAKALADAAIAEKFNAKLGVSCRRILLDSQNRLFETFARSA